MVILLYVSAKKFVYNLLHVPGAIALKAAAPPGCQKFSSSGIRLDKKSNHELSVTPT